MKFPTALSPAVKKRPPARTWLGLCAGLALSLGALASAQAAPPANDNFVGRFQLTGTAAVGMGDNTEATRESFERDVTGYRTLWWTWTAPADGAVTINIQGTSFSNRQFAVFNGDQIDQLKLIGTGSGNGSLTFPTVAGAVYQISVGTNNTSSGVGYEVGTAVLNVKIGASTITSPVVIGTPSDGNDNFEARTTLSGLAVSGIGYNYEAVRESFEPSASGYRTLWWTWTAPADGTVTISTQGTDFSNRQTAAYNGNSIDQLTVVDYDTGTNSLVFPTVAGVVYQISVGANNSSSGVGYEVGSVVLNIKLGPKTITSPSVVQPPAAANDNFANRVALSGPAVTGIGHPLSATRESLEPSGTGNNTLWWTWTAPSKGILTVDTAGTGFNNRYIVYTGNSVDTLTAVVGYNNTATSSVSSSFAVESGGTYQIVVSAQGTTGATSLLNLSLAPHPAFFDGEVQVPGGFYYLQLPNGTPFGYYSYASYPYLYHNDLGFEYFFDAKDGKGGTYLYDFTSRTFFYTSPSFAFPYLYDFTLRTVLYYYPNPTDPTHYNTNGTRYFYRFDTGRIITK